MEMRQTGTGSANPLSSEAPRWKYEGTRLGRQEINAEVLDCGAIGGIARGG
jgi:phage terminase large subunit-like protein